MRITKKAALACALTGLVAGVLPGLASPAQAAADHVVINEAYLSGGSANAPFKDKFVELYNPTDTAVDLSQWSLQYRPATGTGASSTTVALTGSIKPKGHYLIKGASNGATGAELPTPDVTSGLNVSGSGGTLALVKQAGATTLPTGSVTGSSQVADLVGYGTSNTFETAAAPAPASNSDPKSLNRAAAADTDDNSADVSLSASVTPTASGGGSDPGDPGPAEEATIEQIQGEGDHTPYAGKNVVTEGVVTAAYPTGGFRGVYIQTAGTGGDLDLAGHEASNALFVFSDTAAASAKIGDHVEVTGTASEFRSQTQITPRADGVEVLAEPAEAVKPAAVAFPGEETQRETLEGMLLAPAGAYTITDNYDTNFYGSIGLATGTKPLIQPTQIARPGTDAYRAAVAANTARAVTLDDGASTNFNSAANKGKPLPYLTPGGQVRVGAAVTFTQPVILDYRNDLWNFEPTSELTAANADVVQPATFAKTRTDAPEDVGGKLKIGSFNVLNYFSTTGDEATGCSYYNDRAGNPITVDQCSGEGPRGAANEENLKRQEVKIVNAINSLGADVVSLEEIENSAKFGKDRDDALGNLVTALNAGAGSDVWAYVKSPAQLPAIGDEDVIRTAFIYKKAKVTTLGDSQILIGSPAFTNAREPLAQAFKAVGDTDSEAFAIIVNHFKSKGSGSGDDADQGDGQGGSNASRVRQANALVEFADSFKTSAKTNKVFLSGDFNAYSQEDPLQVLQQAGYVDLESKYTDKETYVFNGQIGSLDHIFASPAAAEEVTGLDIWNINSVEPLANEYSRYNYNATILYDESPFRSSDHDPLVVGFGETKPAPVDPTATVSARAKCYGTRASVAVYARNTSNGTIDAIRLSTSYGDKVFTRIAPGQAVYAEFTTKAKKARAGRANVRTYVWNGGKPASRSYAAPYSAIRCR